jgi:trimethylamine--corrinoid protein Co-methyltransferase
MLEFESCQSVEKLVVDHEIIGMALRVGRGITPRDDFPVRPRVEELLTEGHLLISDHSLKHLADEHHFPGPVIERANLSRWQEEGGLSVEAKARAVADDLEASWQPPGLSADTESDLVELMTAAAAAHGMDRLPEVTG